MSRGRNKVTEDLPKKSLNKEGFKHLLGIFRYTLPYKIVFIIGLIFLVLSTATSLAFPYIASLLADASLGEEGAVSWSINQIALGLLVILILQGIFSYLRIVLFSIVSEKAMADIRRDLYAKLISLNIPFFENRRVGELSSRMTADVTQLQNTLSIYLAEFLRQIATLIIGIGIIAMTSIKLTLWMLSTFPIAIIAAMVFGGYIRKLSRQTQDALAESNVIVEESLQAISVVKAFTNEWFEQIRYNRSMDKVVDLALKAARYRGAFVSFLISAVFGGIIIVLWQGALLVEAGAMTIGELVRFVLYTFFIGGAMGGMGDLYGNIQKSIGSSERISDLLKEESEVKVRTPKTGLTTSPKQKINGDIDFENVKFHYPTRKDIRVLKNISLHIPQGSKIALVGHSGAGKSTIIQLLLRFYAVDSGRILVDGKNVEDYDISSYRENIGMVPQEVMLFGGTIRDNIAYGNPAANEEAIYEAAKKANALEFIETFPETFDTLVGERGVKLSGGQRQRIAIARAILKNPSILILDEATSSLDSESENLVQSALNELMKNRTTIIIAHRLSTIREVDCIYVLEGGEIVEKGSHDVLAGMEEGMYYNLLYNQG
ncbi:MAG: ABC transporter transmembrane domain-containing protein [Chitinophagales bacterium]